MDNHHTEPNGIPGSKNEKEADIIFADVITGASGTECDPAVMKLEKMEEALRAKTAELMAAHKEVESFSSIVHYLRNPLNSIIACGEIIELEFGRDPSKDAREAIGHIMRSADCMSRIITHLSWLSQISKRKLCREKVNLSAIVGQCLEKITSSDPGRRLQCDIEPNLTDDADFSLINILLENLVGNAWKFTSKAELVRIEFGRKHVDGHPAYFISDNGAGFDMTYIDRLFKPLQRLHSQKEFQGAGLGLATVKRIADKHGGAAWAEGSINKGATFYFHLGTSSAAG